MSQGIINVLDSNTMDPIPNAQISGKVNTSPCAWDAVGCSSGPGYSVDVYTGTNGQAQFTFPYTCPQSLNLVVAASGYNSQPLQQQTGDITGNVYWKILMTPASIGGSTPPGQGVTAGWGNSIGQFFSNLGGSFASASLGVEIVLSVVAVAVVLVMVFLLTHSPPSGGVAGAPA